MELWGICHYLTQEVIIAAESPYLNKGFEFQDGNFGLTGLKLRLETAGGYSAPAIEPILTRCDHRGQRTIFDENGKKATTEIPEAKSEPWFDLTPVARVPSELPLIDAVARNGRPDVVRTRCNTKTKRIDVLELTTSYNDPFIVWPAPGMPALVEGQTPRLRLIAAVANGKTGSVARWAERLAFRKTFGETIGGGSLLRSRRPGERPFSFTRRCLTHHMTSHWRHCDPSVVLKNRRGVVRAGR